MGPSALGLRRGDSCVRGDVVLKVFAPILRVDIDHGQAGHGPGHDADVGRGPLREPGHDFFVGGDALLVLRPAQERLFVCADRDDGPSPCVCTRGRLRAYRRL
ncbi:MAG: hypothetical protein MZV70_54560 [Desulfobacterales bacterium]|nr:hypothetical protein [Desulfobacterales bacterium]